MKPLLITGVGRTLIAPLAVSILAIADELASAAELLMDKTTSVLVAVVRNYPYKRAEVGVRTCSWRLISAGSAPIFEKYFVNPTKKVVFTVDGC